MRDLTTGMVTAVDSSNIRPVLMVSIALASHTAYCFSGVGQIVWQGNTYLGAGDLGKISDLTETTSQTAQGASFSLSGIDKTLLGESLSEIKIGRPITVYLGMVTSIGQLVPDPYLIFRGRIDKPTVTTGTTQCTISLAAESRFNDQKRAQVSRYTSEDQKRNYPNDTGFDFVPALADSAFQWGS